MLVNGRYFVLTYLRHLILNAAVYNLVDRRQEHVNEALINMGKLKKITLVQKLNPIKTPVIKIHR